MKDERRNHLFLVTFVHSVLISQISAGDNEIKVKVNQGTLIGEKLTVVTGDGDYYSFKGIPYGKPPLRELRFKAPVAAPKWRGARLAKRHGPVCPHVNILTNELVPGDEDCLFLNVYTPKLNPRTPLSVIFYIHGGGFKSGSGDVDRFGPDFFMTKHGILVTFNYRLDVLGFLSLDTEEVPGNAGLKDQVLALKWVKSNIKHFGGDPEKITIMGQSAGGASVGFHMISPMSRGLFRRAIALSGSPYCDWALSYQPVLRAFKLGHQFGLDTRDPAALLSFLRTLPADQLITYKRHPNVFAFEEIIPTSIIGKQYQFAPVVEKFSGENNFLSVQLFNSSFEHTTTEDVLFGYTSAEGLAVLATPTTQLFEPYQSFIEMFTPRKIMDKYTPDKVLDVGRRVRDYYFSNKSINVSSLREFVNFAGDAYFNYDVIQFFSRFPNKGRKYMYKFSGESTRNVYGNKGIKYGIRGVGHNDDVSNLFEERARHLPPPAGAQARIIHTFTTVIRDFVVDGNPGASVKVKWPQFSSAIMKYGNIDNTVTVKDLKKQAFIGFWDDLYKSVGFQYYKS
ncbi:esterase B1-like [Anticarsia gemmatalis]|uniref:esterase B1-like n=1 Tax=Anticarsia gemmatalis TaxID=129554 RepID=UPI003F75F579